MNENRHGKIIYSFILAILGRLFKEGEAKEV